MSNSQNVYSIYETVTRGVVGVPDIHVWTDNRDRQGRSAVELVVAEVLQTGSISLARPDDSISEPSVLRRVDGSSVYTVAGSELYTSARLVAAEQRLVRTAGRIDGRIPDGDTVELALLESAANGDSLDAGQTALVRGMCIPARRTDTNSRSVEDSRLSSARNAPPARELGHRVRRGCEGRSADARTRARPGRSTCTATYLATDSMLWPMPWTRRGPQRFLVCTPLCATGEVIELTRDAK